MAVAAGCDAAGSPTVLRVASASTLSCYCWAGGFHAAAWGLRVLGRTKGGSRAGLGGDPHPETVH